MERHHENRRFVGVCVVDNEGWGLSGGERHSQMKRWMVSGPKRVTADKSSVRIAVESIGEAETAAVFGGWTHTDACWSPSRVRSGSARPTAGNSTRDLVKVDMLLLRHLDDAVDTLKRCQWFGSEWQRVVQRQPELAKFTGAFYDRPWRAPGEGRRIDPGWAGRSAQLYSRLWIAWAVDSFAWAYLAEESRHHGDEELLRRVVARADCLFRAQTATGGLEIERGNLRCCPERKPGGGCHEGFALWPVCSALLRVFEHLSRAGAFEMTIDSNGDGTVDTPRRQAYARLLQNWAARVINDPIHARGHAPNQDAGNFLALALANELHTRLIGKPLLRSDQLAAYRDELFGARPSAYLVLSGDWANRFGSRRWFTSKGLLLEGRAGYYGSNPHNHGAGYDAGYGQLTLFLLGEYARIGERVLLVVVPENLPVRVLPVGVHQEYATRNRIEVGIVFHDDPEFDLGSHDRRNGHPPSATRPQASPSPTDTAPDRR